LKYSLTATPPFTCTAPVSLSAALSDAAILSLSVVILYQTELYVNPSRRVHFVNIY
jgi:hypothetical protein